jgi:hypothetical protein
MLVQAHIQRGKLKNLSPYQGEIRLEVSGAVALGRFSGSEIAGQLHSLDLLNII